MDCEVREYSMLFTKAFPGKRRKKSVDFILDYNKDSKVVYKNAKFQRVVGENIKEKQARFQFERKGFYVTDYDTDLSKGKLVFNQIVAMKQSKKKTY